MVPLSQVLAKPKKIKKRIIMGKVKFKQSKVKDVRRVAELSIQDLSNVICASFYKVLADNDLLLAVEGVQQDEAVLPGDRYIFGLAGLCAEFGCGHNTAQRLKDTILKDAVMQAGPGCKVIIDRQMAHKLYREYKREEV